MHIYQTHQVKTTDIIVGIPSYNEADNIAFVVEKCNQGLRKYFPNYKSVIINVDNNSPDDTRSVFITSVNTIPKIYISTPIGVKGKGNNLNNLFKISNRLKAKAIIVVDADLYSITPEWIKKLAQPILENKFDYLTPVYARNEYDGTITNHICYPLILGLLGYDIRQPIGGDFALSAKLGQYYLKQNWIETTRQYGIDIFMTLHAIMGNFKLGQVSLGAKVHKPSMPKLGPMFTQVVETLFTTILNKKELWNSTQKVHRLELFGKNNVICPQKLSVDYKSIKNEARNEFFAKRETLSQYLHLQNFEKLCLMFDTGKLNIGMDLWAKCLYDLLFSYHKSGYDSDIVEALRPIYFGRVSSFIRQTLDMDHLESEHQIIRQSKYFYKKRSYFIQKYLKKRFTLQRQKHRMPANL
jgi:glycosyltransferase involved in cell wall biosynthesis